MYDQMVAKVAEFTILLDLPEAEIARLSSDRVAQAIIRVRSGRVHVVAGYDGIFGVVNAFADEEKQAGFAVPQKPLF